MRVTSFPWHPDRREGEEGGAVAVLVAITLIAILSMVVLTIDVGGMLLKRRQMVNGADAAALAAAQSCASTTDTTNPETEADTNATMNVPGLSASDGGITSVVGCDANGSGHVTVNYSTQQPLFFAQVLGFGNSATVATTATAAWGAIGGANNPVPIVLNQATFQGNCNIPLPDSQIGTQCYLWYDNDRFVGSNFGFLSLDQWNVDPNSTNCNAAGGSSKLEDWINGNYTGPTLMLNYPNPTYVCTTSGNRSSVWNTLANHIGQILMFPINDQTKQIVGGGGQTNFFDIVGFASLRVDAVYPANQAPSSCGPPPKNNSAHCLIISWQGYQFGGVNPGGGADFGTRAIRLCDPTIAPCP
jgi:hypothetical protein